MKIAVLQQPRRFELVEEPVPQIQDDEVLVRTAACGVCASELDMWLGEGSSPLPLYPGHEVSGTVVSVGSRVTGLREGDQVAVWATGRGFAEYVAVKAAYCRPAEGVSLEEALAEPLACAANAVELADVRLGDDVVIVGAGFMGHLVQQLVQLRGPRQVIVADTRADALSRADEMGATRTVDVTRESLADVVGELTQGVGADISFEVTGVQAALDVLGDVTRMSGKVAIVGYHQGAPRQLPLAQWNWTAFQVVNAHFRDVNTIMRGMTVGMRLLAARRISLEKLVTDRFSLEEINDAFEVAVRKPEGFVKATVAFD